MIKINKKKNYLLINNFISLSSTSNFKKDKYEENFEDGITPIFALSYIFKIKLVKVNSIQV